MDASPHTCNFADYSDLIAARIAEDEIAAGVAEGAKWEDADFGAVPGTSVAA